MKQTMEANYSACVTCKGVFRTRFLADCIAIDLHTRGSTYFQSQFEEPGPTLSMK